MRKVSGIVVMILMALMLAACGGEGTSDEDAEPAGQSGDDESVSTAVSEPTQTVESTQTVAPTATEIEEEQEAGDGTPAASPEASPVNGEATPVTEASPAADATPVTEASPEASPAASPVTEASPAANAATSPVAASPVSATPAAVAEVEPPTSATEASPAPDADEEVSLTGRVELAGERNSAWTLGDEGCVGLGGNEDLGSGHQVVIRDEAGVIVGVTELEESDETDACIWTFAADVAASDYYAISIPMKTELVFSHEDIEENQGDVMIVLR